MVISRTKLNHAQKNKPTTDNTRDLTPRRDKKIERRREREKRTRPSRRLDPRSLRRPTTKNKTNDRPGRKKIRGSRHVGGGYEGLYLSTQTTCLRRNRSQRIFFGFRGFDFVSDSEGPQTSFTSLVFSFDSYGIFLFFFVTSFPRLYRFSFTSCNFLAVHFAGEIFVLFLTSQHATFFTLPGL